MGAIIQMHHAVVARMRGGGVVVPPPVEFADDFNRANANPMSDPATGGTWTSGPGGLNGCEITGNKLAGTASYSGARVLTPAFPSDHSASITIATLGGFWGPCVRMQSPTDASCYLAGVNAGTTLYIYKITQSADPLAGGDFAQLGATVAVAPVVGDVLALEAVSGVLNVYLNDVLIATRGDSTFVGGQPGVFFIGGVVIEAFNSVGGSGSASAILGTMAVGTTFTIA